MPKSAIARPTWWRRRLASLFTSCVCFLARGRGSARGRAILTKQARTGRWRDDATVILPSWLAPNFDGAVAVRATGFWHHLVTAVALSLAYSVRRAHREQGSPVWSTRGLTRVGERETRGFNEHSARSRLARDVRRLSVGDAGRVCAGAGPSGRCDSGWSRRCGRAGD